MFLSSEEAAVAAVAKSLMKVDLVVVPEDLELLHQFQYQLLLVHIQSPLVAVVAVDSIHKLEEIVVVILYLLLQVHLTQLDLKVAVEESPTLVPDKTVVLVVEDRTPLPPQVVQETE